MNKSFYRPEIDGLRALAIIPVVLFHAKFVGFSGGFIGVDIFFVISGYLITSILKREMENGTFSFVTFWARRVRRIFPALITVATATLVASYLFLVFPPDLLEYGKSVVGLSLFASNMFFMRKQGYFGGPAEASPLLHTWTLSVEEQFYIILPLVLFFGWKYLRNKPRPLFLCLGLLSFCYSIYLVTIAPGHDFAIPFLPSVWGGAINLTAGFYILPSRMWEFLIGSLLAYTTATCSSKKVAEGLSLLGTSMIIYAISTYTALTPFPGIAALLPVCGSALIIFATTTHETLIKKILSFPAIVAIGLISYPLYLWHWPILVFARTLFGTITPFQTGLLIILSVALSWITYSVIERPFREKRILVTSKQILTAGFCCLVFLFGAGYAFGYTHIHNPHIPAYAKELLAASEQFGPKYYECFKNKNIKNETPCTIGSDDPTIPVTFIVWGDSHAASVVDTLNTLAEERHAKGAVFSYGDCIPITGVSLSPLRADCKIVQEHARQYIIDQKITHVLLVARWNYYLDAASTRNWLVDGSSKTVSEQESKRVFSNDLANMVSELNTAGQSVTILAQVPEHKNFDLRTTFYASINNRGATNIDPLLYSEHETYTAYANTVFTQLAEKNHTQILYPEKILCPLDSTCLFYDQHHAILYADDSHLNQTGSDMLSPTLNEFIQTL